MRACATAVAARAAGRFRMNPQIDQAITWLNRSGVIAYPTEAVFGLGCRADRSAPVRRILSLKQRPESAGLIVLVDHLDRLEDWIIAPGADQRRRLDASWPGPVTWLLPASPRCPTWLCGAHDTLAVRISAHPVCAALAAGLKIPLVSTSANRSGQAPARSVAELDAAFEGELDYVLDGPVDRQATPSAIYDLLTGRRVR